MRRLIMRLKGLSKRHVERELAEEFESHFAMHIEDNLRAGMSQEEAVRQARLKFGGIETAKEDYREVAGFAWFDALIQDFRFGLRMLMKSPGWSIVVGATLALGVGLTTTIFSIVYSVLWQPLPYHEPNRLVTLWSSSRDSATSRYAMIAGNWQDIRQQSKSFDDIALVRNSINFNLTGSGEPERLLGVLTTANLPRILGMQPALGRTFTDAEVQADARVVVLGYGLWQRRFGGEPGVVGRKIQLNGAAYEVIGVMPLEYRYPSPESDLWVPLSVTGVELQQRVASQFLSVGRLKPEANLSQVQQEVSAIMLRLEQLYPVSNRNVSVRIEPFDESLLGESRTPLLALTGASASLLLIGCLNMSILLILRAGSREKEMAVRAALGAGSGRLKRQFLAELVPLSAAGIAAGLVLARLLIDLSRAWLPANLPRAAEVGLHLPALAFCAAMSVAAVFLSALLPARLASRVPVGQALQASSRTSSGRSAGRDLLVTAQVAIALVMVFGGGLLARSLGEVLKVNPGFSPEGVLTLHFAVTRADFPGVGRVGQYQQRVVDRVQSVPGVRVAAYISRLPLSGANQTIGTESEGTGVKAAMDTRTLTPGYFEAMGIPLLRGRNISAFDRIDSTLVAIVDEAAARQFFGAEDPIGKRIRFYPGTPGPWIEIVGVVGHLRHESVEADSRPLIYMPHTQRLQERGALVVRTSGDPAALTSSILAAIRAENPNQAVFDVRTMTDWVDRTLASRRLVTNLIGLFGGAALLLACLGLYGVVAYTARMRWREFGLRLALGASPVDVRKAVLWHAVRLAAIGILVGALLSWPVSMAIRGLLFGVTPGDPFSIVAAPLALIAAALLAAAVPARLAGRLDPMEILRSE